MEKSLKIPTLLIIAFTICLVNIVKGQTTPVNTLKLGVGIEAAGVSGTINGATVEWGATARLQYWLAKKLALTLTSGYYSFSFVGERLVNPGDGFAFNPNFNFQVVPVKVGVKYFFIHHAYVSGEAGAGFADNSEKGTKLILSPSVGFASKSWDVGLRYESFSTQYTNLGMVALNVTYGFSL
ncbi:MAG: hypothetical protein JWR12_1309 [Mucilaginibacter sp.]|nr:hypothetical protein [Mucilaginibacter sp.]